MADIEAPLHSITSEHGARQQGIANTAISRLIRAVQSERNWFRNLPKTIASLRATRYGISSDTTTAANQAYTSSVEFIQIGARAAAVELTENIGPYMGDPRNQAYRGRVSLRVADQSRILQDTVTNRAVEANRSLWIVGDTYRAMLADPARTALIGAVIVATGLSLNYGIKGADNVLLGTRLVGEFLFAHGVIGYVKDALVNLHRFPRNITIAGIEDLLSSEAGLNEERIVTGDDNPRTADEYDVIGQVTDRIGSAVSQELTLRGATLPIVINTTVGVRETVEGVRNTLHEVNPFNLWIEKMVEQRRARLIVFALAGAATLLGAWTDISNRSIPTEPIPAVTPISRVYTPTAVSTATLTMTPTPRSTESPRSTETSIPTATPAVVIEYFKNPDHYFAPHDDTVSDLVGYSWSLIADVDLDWVRKYGHRFNASAKDMEYLDEEIRSNRNYFEYRAQLYADKIRELNKGRYVIFGREIDHSASNAPDGIPGLFRPTDDQLRQLK